jgi:undecaprenyl-phosphate 4-deoxy-4-formamido-L-arabinose transferase
VGPEAEGVFSLFGVVFFFIGLALFGIGLLGEYVGRIYAQVRERPRYLVEAVLEAGRRDGVPTAPLAASVPPVTAVPTAASVAPATAVTPPPAEVLSR